MSWAASHANKPSKATPEKISRTGPSPARSPIPRSCVEPPVTHFSPTRERPRRMNRNASVTMKEGSFVRITICPLMPPSRAANTKVSAMAAMSGSPDWTRRAPKMRPVKAIIDPIERSNSPPIMRRAAAIARIPSCAAGARTFITPASVNIDASAVARKKIVTRTRPAAAPSSGRRMARVASEVVFRRSSRAAAVGAAFKLTAAWLVSAIAASLLGTRRPAFRAAAISGCPSPRDQRPEPLSPW